MQKGIFIVIDWTDWSGKWTQTKLLVERLKGEWYDVEIADFPQYWKKSAWMVEEYLNWNLWTADEVWPYRASVFYAIDRYEASPRIKKRLEEWKIVISNRYVSSNMWHQAGKIHDLTERDKFLEWLDEFEYWLFWIPRPDMNILLYMPTEIWQQLVDQKWKREYTDKKRDIHEADLNHLKNAAEAYKYVADKYNRTIIDSAPNGKLKSIEEISDELWNIVTNKIITLQIS
jgi:dTMP kinase